MKSGPRLPQLEKALAQKRRPNTPKQGSWGWCFCPPERAGWESGVWEVTFFALITATSVLLCRVQPWQNGKG